jgi:hypothetical protein
MSSHVAVQVPTLDRTACSSTERWSSLNLET